jgi:hypothetical protein
LGEDNHRNVAIKYMKIDPNFTPSSITGISKKTVLIMSTVIGLPLVGMFILNFAMVNNQEQLRLSQYEITRGEVKEFKAVFESSKTSVDDEVEQINRRISAYGLHQVIEDTAKQAAATVPIKTNKVTTLTTVDFTPPTILHYKYRLDNSRIMIDESATHDQKLKQRIFDSERFCSHPTIRQLLDYGMIYMGTYYNNNGDFIFETKVDNLVCLGVTRPLDY